jgi:hypothetical protein
MHKAPQEPAKAAILEETGREGKEKEKREKKGERLPPPQANTMIRRYLTTQANPEVSKRNQGKTLTGDGYLVMGKYAR